MKTNGEKEAQEISKTLNIMLPLGSIPLPIKVIALLTYIGGLSIVASVFADIVWPQRVSWFFYFVRMLTGVLMILVGYGLIKKREWSAWLYGAISFIGLFVNPLLAILPIAITFYLYFNRTYFTGGTIVDFRNILRGWVTKHVDEDEFQKS